MSTTTKPMALQAWVKLYAVENDITHGTAESYRYAVNSLEKWAGGPLDCQQAADRLNEYITDCVNTCRSKRTAKARRSALTVILRAAGVAGHCQPPKKWRTVKVPQQRPHAFSPEELATLLEHGNPIQRAAILLNYDTGLRKSDILSVRWSQVFKKPDGWRLYHTARKTGRQIVRRLRPETVAALELVRNPQDDRLVPWPFNRNCFDVHWKRLGAEVGICMKGRGLQAIRRLGATMSKKAGYSAMEYLGHSYKSAGVAEEFYLDPTLLDEAPPLPPALNTEAK